VIREGFIRNRPNRLGRKTVKLRTFTNRHREGCSGILRNQDRARDTGLCVRKNKVSCLDMHVPGVLLQSRAGENQGGWTCVRCGRTSWPQVAFDLERDVLGLGRLPIRSLPAKNHRDHVSLRFRDVSDGSSRTGRPGRSLRGVAEARVAPRKGKKKQAERSGGFADGSHRRGYVGVA